MGRYEVAYPHVPRTRSSPLPAYVLTLWAVLGGAGAYLFAATGDVDAAMVGLVMLVGVMLIAIAHSVVVPARASSAASGAIALVSAAAIVTIILPASGNIFVDGVVLLGAVIGGVTLFARAVELPDIGRARLRESSVALVIFLPILLAYAEAAALGLRFWESFPLGAPSYLFIPCLALWGFAEEGLFRGIVQRSFRGVMGAPAAVVTAALLNAAYMLFWGSIMYAAFAFLVGLLMGVLYHRSRSLMYVGTIRALMDTWLIIAFLSLGLVTA